MDNQLELEFHTLDVFTRSRFHGNPLAVVMGGEALSTEKMQSIAREFNLSETVFVLPADDPNHSARLRIFTPGHEIPFAGHPTVGTAALLAEIRVGSTGTKQDALVVLEEQVGLVRCGANCIPGQATYVEFDLPQLPGEAGTCADREQIAAALGIGHREIGFENHVPVIFSAGLPFQCIPLANTAVLAAAQVQAEYWDDAFAMERCGSVFLYCREAANGEADFRARMFAPAYGIPEDPATGSAVAALAGVIQRFDQPRTGTHRYRVQQGVEMGRPSLIEVELDVSGGALAGARIGGHAVHVMSGTLRI